MHIKQLTIHGFKSYREETVVGPLHPGRNVVVGRNGSGKSNFFAAIRFALNDAYSRLSSPEERLALIYEGAPAAYVEIVFDNADGRFPTGREETIIRRTLTPHRDDFALDGKAVSKTDIDNLLQSAGFSKSNPYYIVPQGRITTLCNATDAQRLALLKEVAGTRVYEEHRRESARILDETVAKRQKITELLVFIEERLCELDGERALLDDFERIDGRRRAIEIVLYQRELRSIQAQLQQLSNQQDNAEGDSEVAKLQEQITALQEQLVLDQSALDTLQQQMLAGTEEHEARVQRTVERDFCAQENARITQEINSVDANIANTDEAIQGLEAQLSVLHPQYSTLREQCDGAAQEEGRAKAVVDSLAQRMERRRLFRTPREWQAHLQAEVAGAKEHWEQVQQQEATATEELKGLQLRQQDLLADLQAVQSADTHSQLCHQAQIQRRKHLAASLKDVQKRMGKMQQAQRALEGDVGRCAESARCTNDLAGMERVKALGRQHGIPVLGAVYELFSVDPAFRPCAQVIGGAALFNVVVPQHTHALRLMDLLSSSSTKSKSSAEFRITFAPLNRLLHHSVHDKKKIMVDREQAVPLLDHVQAVEAAAEPVLRQIFGGAYVVPDLAVGSVVARTHGVTCVTLQGDRADSHGCLTGGRSMFKDGDDFDEEGEGSDRLGTLARLRDLQVRLTQCSQQLLQLAEEKGQLEAQLASLSNADLDDHAQSAGHDKGRSGGELLAMELENVQALVDLKTKQLQEARVLSHSLQARVRCLETQAADADSGHEEDHDDDKALEEVTQQLAAAQAKVETLTTRRLEAEQAVSSAAAALQVLNRQRLDLLSTLTFLRTSLPELLEEMDDREAMQDEGGDDYEAQKRIMAEQMSTLEASIERLRTDLDAGMTQLLQRHRNEKEGERVERQLARRAALLQHQEECRRKLRALGPVSATHRLPYEQAAENALLRELQAIKAELQTLGPVNSRAQQQHAGFGRQAEALRRRQAGLERSELSIRQYMRTLDQRKAEAIRGTFDTVSRHFSAIWRLLVPTGHADLLIQRPHSPDTERQPNSNANDQGANNQDANHHDANHQNGQQDEEMKEYAGVGIRVSFVDGDELLPSQLSGGQKSLLALCLILSIQRVDPAPFYLFDEVDANLDAQYRTAVARLLQEQNCQGQGQDQKSHQDRGDNDRYPGDPKKAAATTQYVMTTFRPELVHASEQCWGVTCRDRVSHLQPITHAQALDFVVVASSNT